MLYLRVARVQSEFLEVLSERRRADAGRLIVPKVSSLCAKEALAQEAAEFEPGDSDGGGSLTSCVVLLPKGSHALALATSMPRLRRALVACFLHSQGQGERAACRDVQTTQRIQLAALTGLCELENRSLVRSCRSLGL